jgi:putative SOS response-associated peptidase YedK
MKKLVAKLINARIETLQGKTSFRSILFISKRFIIFADGFFEWIKTLL